jgi:tetratricopeptide (TPR) repeat protein
MCLAELGAFAEGRALGEVALRLVESVDHPFSLAWACVAVGHLFLRQGALPQAVHVLERGLTLSETANLPVIFPHCNSRLGAAYALSGQVTEGLSLLERALEQIVAMRRTFFYPLYAVWLGESYVLAGRREEAKPLGQQALETALARKQQSYQAYALRLLGEIGTYSDLPDVELAETHYRQALTLARELGMRPLQAHCHHSLGARYGQTGWVDQARAALTTAINLYRAMEMTFWLPQAEAALAQVEGG